MGKRKLTKPIKKTDGELFQLLSEKIASSDYVFLAHAKQRLKDRDITDIEVLDILENKRDCNRRRNKAKDKYAEGYQDWNYCIEGCNVDGDKIRIIISFMDDLMPIITVISLDN